MYFSRSFTRGSASLLITTVLLTLACQKVDPIKRPVPSTLPVTAVTCHSALLGGRIVFDVEKEISARGFAWCDVSEPDTFNHVVYCNSDSLEFYALLEGLTLDKVYYVRAFLVTEGELIFADETNFKTKPCTGVNYEGRYYDAVKIGNQCWMSENLDIGNIIPGAVNQADNGIIEKYAYNDDSLNTLNLGGLYQWKEAVDYECGSVGKGTNVAGIAPPGWHIPADAEWMELERTLGMSEGDANITGWRGNIGAQLAPGGSSGFDVKFGGTRSNAGFQEGNAFGYYWTATDVGTFDSWYRCFDPASGKVKRDIGGHYMGMSLRCIKD